MDSQTTMEQSVSSIREKFLTHYDKNEDLFHELDVKRVRTDDWQIERFVIDQQNEGLAYNALVKALQWKKSFGVHERTDHYFPKEYFEFSELHNFGTDKKGRLIKWEKTRTERNISELNMLSKQFVAHLMEKIDNEVNRNGFILVSDTNGTGLSNVNMETFKFKIEITSYYPELLMNNLIVDLPWMLSGVAKIILSFCGPTLRERVQFVSRKDLLKYVDAELIPKELDGEREPKIIIPDGVKLMKDLPHLNVSDKVIQKYYKSYNLKI